MRTLNIDDCSQEYVDWINDSQINRYLETRWSTQDMETVKSYVATMLESPDNLLFDIFLKEDDRHIGNFDNIVDEVLISLYIVFRL